MERMAFDESAATIASNSILKLCHDVQSAEETSSTQGAGKVSGAFEVQQTARGVDLSGTLKTMVMLLGNALTNAKDAKCVSGLGVCAWQGWSSPWARPFFKRA